MLLSYYKFFIVSHIALTIDTMEIASMDIKATGGINNKICTHLGNSSYNVSTLRYKAKLNANAANAANIIVNIVNTIILFVLLINMLHIQICRP